MKKFILLIVFFSNMFITINVHAAYLKDIPLKITQPDGTIIECLASGDEFHNWTHDENNFTIIQDHETGWYVYATVVNDKLVPSSYIVGTIDPIQAGLKPGVNITTEEWKNKRSEHYYGLENTRSGTPNTGTVNNLVVFIRFNDQDEFTSYFSWYDNMFNETTDRSLLNYYNEVSNGQLHFNSHLFPVPPFYHTVSYQDSHDRGYFCPYDATTNPIGYESSTQRKERRSQLFRDAIAYVNPEIPPEIDFDLDNDGQVDAAVFIINGEPSDWNTLLWPHCSSIEAAPYPNVNGASIVVYNLQIQSMISVGVICHEMFHSIGAPDLYHYDENSTVNPAGSWDLMASGSSHMLTYMKWKYGQWFSTIPILSVPGTYTLPPISTNPYSCYKILSPNSSDEFFMVEYRKQEGIYESDLPGSGLIVYRIDTTAGNGNANGPPDEVYVYRPDGYTTINGSIDSAHLSLQVGRTGINQYTNPTPFLQDGSAGGLVLYGVGYFGNTISFNFADDIDLTLYWEGDVSNDWNDGSNWTNDGIPASYQDVVIPSGTPYQPTIGTLTYAVCENITIESGAVLTQTGMEPFGSSFCVNGNFNSNAGTFTQNSDYAYLAFEGLNLMMYSYWDDENEDDTYTMVRVNMGYPMTLVMQQNMTVKGLEITKGNFKIDGTKTLTVTGDLSSAFQVENGGFLTLEDGTIDIINGDIEFEDGSRADVSGGLIRCGEDFRVWGNTAYDIQFTGGTVEMVGSSTQYIQDLDGNTELYNLSINKSAGTCFVHVGDLILNNDLTIHNGTLNSNIYDIYLGGDWTNNVGDAGFIEGTGAAIFNGSEYSEITTDETFYNLTLNSTSTHMNGLQLNYGHTATIINDLSIIDGSFELNSTSTLIVGNDVYIANGCGLNAYGDFGLELFVGGDWTNHNTFWNTSLGYSPGTEVITFNGSADQIITTLAPQEDFGTLVIDKSGGEFRPNDNIHVMHDFDILAGVWHDNTSLLTHYFEGDFYIAAGAAGYWNSMTDNTVVFTGINDQAVFNTVGVGYFRNIVIDKTEWSARNIGDHEGTEFSLSMKEKISPIIYESESRNTTVTLMSDIDMQFGVGLTIEEGTLNLNGMNLNSMGDVVVLLGGTLVVDEGATLQVSNGNELSVYNGGVLEVLGSPGNLATISHRVFGNYDFNIYPGGKIYAEYGLFENMTAEGVHVWEGGIIDRTYSFNYCTFQNGFVGYGTLLYINNVDDVTITGANFPDNSSTDFNVAKTQFPDSGTISMINATGIFAGEDFDQDDYDLINWDGLAPIDDLTIYYDVLDNKIVLQWNYPVPVDQFKVYRSPDPYDFSIGDVFITDENWYSEPATGINYFYRVTAENISDKR